MYVIGILGNVKYRPSAARRSRDSLTHSDASLARRVISVFILIVLHKHISTWWVCFIQLLYSVFTYVVVDHGLQRWLSGSHAGQGLCSDCI